ncbi:MAG: NADH-quinone oxidoreductase subunit N [Acidimicrobiales bacterium]
MSTFGLLGTIGPLPKIDYWALLPEFVLIGGALLLLLVSTLSVKRLPVAVYTAITGVVSVLALAASLELWHKVSAHGAFTTIAKSLDVDGFSVAFAILACCIMIVAAVLADGYLEREQMSGPEYHALALMAASGAIFMAAANDLIVIFLGLEIMSIPLYILAGLDQRRRESGEAAIKYFVLGAFSSAIFVYGIALVYGATGSTNLAEIATYLSNNVLLSNGLLLAGMALLLVGFGFKIAAVPFHMWTPDVYQGAPTPATGFMAAIAKVGGFAALLRVFFSTFHTLSPQWQPLIWGVAIVTMLLGAVVGLVQRDVKRMLAYSSINHAGFILLGLQAATAAGIAASLYYVFVYAFLVLGSFAVVALVAGRGDSHHDLDSYRGLSRRAPVLALAFTVLLLAQAGVPPTTGFLAKFYVVESVVSAHSYVLAVVAMLSGVIAAAFYLRVVFLMYGGSAEPAGDGAAHAVEDGSMVLPAAVAGSGDELGQAVAVALAEVEEADEDLAEADRPISVPGGVQVGLFVCVAFTVVLGIWPGPLFSFVHAAGLLF